MAFVDAWADGVSLAGRGTDEVGNGAVREEGVGRSRRDIMGTCEAFAGVGQANCVVVVLAAA